MFNLINVMSYKYIEQNFCSCQIQTLYKGLKFLIASVVCNLWTVLCNLRMYTGIKHPEVGRKGEISNLGMKNVQS